MTNREGLILEKWVDPQTRIHPWLVWMIRKSRVSRKIRPKIRESRRDLPQSNWNERWKDRRKDIFFFSFFTRI